MSPEALAEIVRPATTGPRWLTAEQLGEQTQHHPVTLRKWAREERIVGAEKHGRSWRFDMTVFKVLPPAPMGVVVRVAQKDRLDNALDALRAA